jgi:hypothetical protein
LDLLRPKRFLNPAVNAGRRHGPMISASQNGMDADAGVDTRIREMVLT